MEATDIRCHVHDVTQSKFKPLAAFLNDILPPILPQKRAEIGQLMQSQLSNPPNTPIISPHPTDINAPIFYYPLVLLLKSYYQTLTRKTRNSVFARMIKPWMTAIYGGREVMLC